jgi:hypothetical protein
LGEGTRLAALTGAWICFEDEAGQSLRPGRARTWAPRGHTPVARVSGNSGRMSVAGMACLKPGRPGRFFYRLQVHRRRKGERPSLSEADCAHLITDAHHALGAPLIVVWDNLNTHRSKKMRAFTAAREDWLTVVQLPGYAPDLNAVEGAWSVMKSGLGNHAARTLDELEIIVRGRLRNIQRRPDLKGAATRDSASARASRLPRSPPAPPETPTPTSAPPKAGARPPPTGGLAACRGPVECMILDGRFTTISPAQAPGLTQGDVGLAVHAPWGMTRPGSELASQPDVSHEFHRY